MDNWRETWFLLRCRENRWNMVLDLLQDAGIETCCPLIHERRRRKDKKQAYRLISSPAFPGYIFVRFDPTIIHTTAIASIPGITEFVRFGREIAVVPDEDINALRYAEYKILHSESDEYECFNLTPELLEKVEEIYTTINPQARVGQLMTLIANENRKKNGTKQQIREQCLCPETGT